MDIFKKLEPQVYSRYERKLTKEVKAGGIPNHIAIIMDGNRRYAKDSGMATNEAHKAGGDKLEEVLWWCMDLGIRYVTVFAFSTENFNRDMDEVGFLLDLFNTSLKDISINEKIHRNHVNIRVIGDMSVLSDELKDTIDAVTRSTKGYSDHFFTIAIAYGSRQEIISAVRDIASKVKSGEMDVADIDEQAISQSLYTYDLPDPDLMLRTSGELRMSNFLLWQMAYSELYFTDVFWPKFRYIDLLRAIRSFQSRTRRYGV